MNTRPPRRMLPLAAPEIFNSAIPESMKQKRKNRLLFMTYNILAQALVRRDMFPLASKKALQWKYRRQNLLEEMLAYAPDIVCLQEVDFWNETYLPAFTKAGYDTIHYRNAKKKHGCAILWRKNRFEKVEQRTIEYDDFGQPTFLTGNVGIMVGLKPVSPKPAENPDPNADMILPEDREDDSKQNGVDQHDSKQDNVSTGGILVATTHLFWRPDGSYERLRQASIFMDQLMDFQKSLKYTVLIGGDFNTTPRDAAYRVMTRNQMPHDQIPKLEAWLKGEVTRLNEAVKLQQAQQQKSEAPQNEASSSSTDASQKDASAGDDVKQLEEKLKSQELDGSNASDIAPPVRNPGAGVLYPAPPTGIVLVNRSNGEKSKEGEGASDGATASNGSAKGEDMPVLAPLEAFTMPQDLVKAIHMHPRCLSIYSQYETTIAQNPQAIAPPSATEAVESKDDKGAEAKETKDDDPYRIKKLHYCHGEPKFTNYATWFKDTLDYVYLLEDTDPNKYTPSPLRLYPQKLLEIPDNSWLGNGLPDEKFSSDHLCLMVEFGMFHTN
ncbi:hypothetical protein BGW42_003918 [Actinomortierella wolfii]|nr:hypothetical protein BGW42_003918 [Actinomortierella wolfii]